MRSATLWWNKLSFLVGLMKGNKPSFVADIYSEKAYLSLVYREFKRSERSGHLCRILLIYYTNAQGRIVPFRSDIIDKTISALSSNCRDTDYIGWYRQGLILGVLLTALRPDSARDGCDSLKTRLVGSLHNALTFMDDHSIQIRVLDQDELTAFNPSGHPARFPVSKD